MTRRPGQQDGSVAGARRPTGSTQRLLAIIAALCLPPPAWAYIDPNAGGLLFQLLAPVFAGIVGVWLFLRQWIAAQVRRLWRRLTGRTEE